MPGGRGRAGSGGVSARGRGFGPPGDAGREPGVQGGMEGCSLTPAGTGLAWGAPSPAIPPQCC